MVSRSFPNFRGCILIVAIGMSSQLSSPATHPWLGSDGPLEDHIPMARTISLRAIKSLKSVPSNSRTKARQNVRLVEIG
jgi:hypothetical protein